MNLLDTQTSAAARTAGATDPHQQMWEMITSYRISQIVRVIAHFHLPEHIAAGRRTGTSIAAAADLSPDATFRLLRAGASLGLFQSSDGDSFDGTPLLATLADGAQGSLRGLALALAEPGHWLPWGRLEEAVRTGTEQTTWVFGRNLWDYYRDTPVEAAHFSEAMSGMTAAVGEAAAQIIDTAPFKLAADVGGAGGSLLHDLLVVNPHLRGIVFDLPHVVEHAEMESRRRGLADRVTAVGGDFFVEVPRADLYLLRYILHDWDDGACMAILRNCRRAMESGGRVIVLETVIGAVGEPSPGPLQDMQMLVGLPGGRERSVDEFDRLFGAADLRLVRATDTATPVTILEAAAA